MTSWRLLFVHQLPIKQTEQRKSTAEEPRKKLLLELSSESNKRKDPPRNKNKKRQVQKFPVTVAQPKTKTSGGIKQKARPLTFSRSSEQRDLRVVKGRDDSGPGVGSWGELWRPCAKPVWFCFDRARIEKERRSTMRSEEREGSCGKREVRVREDRREPRGPVGRSPPRFLFFFLVYIIWLLAN